MWKVLISAPYMQPVVDRFTPLFEKNSLDIVVPPVDERMNEDDLLAVISDIDGVISGDDAFTERVLDAAPKLKVISKWGTGIDSIDQEACAKRGIAVRNTLNAFSEPVADSVLCYMLCFARRPFEMTTAMRAGHWEKIPGVALNELTVGIIGVGNCGKAVARRLAGFGCRILGCDPITPVADFLSSTGMQMVGQDTLLAEADMVTVNCDLNPTSHHIMSTRQFAQMKSTAFFVNTARGPLVDEAALIDALEREEIAGAGLDVFESEPLPPESPLRRMDNVLMAPHNSNSSPSAWERVHHSTLNNLVEELQKHSG